MKNTATKASKLLAKATMEIGKMDAKLAERLTKALAEEMRRYQRGE